MQIVLFFCFAVCELTASAVVFRFAPLNPICVWYQSALVYGVEHLIATVLVVLVIAGVWAVIGNPALWESICHTRQRGWVLFYGGLTGMAIDVVSSVLCNHFSPHTHDPVYELNSGSIVPWILFRVGVWTAAYIVVAALLYALLKVEMHSRRTAGSPPKP